MSATRQSRPAKSGASWEPSSKKIFRLKENIQPKSRTFDKNQHFCRKSRIIRLIKGEKEPKLSAVTSNYFFEGHCTQNFLWKFLETNSKILVVSYCRVSSQPISVHMWCTVSVPQDFAQFVAILNVEKSRIFKENILWLGQVPRKSGTFCRSG